MGLWSNVKRWFGRAETAQAQAIIVAPIPPEPRAGELTVPEPPPPNVVAIEPIARDVILEAAIAEDRDAIGPYLVYADWLQERGDPRGELISIQCGMEDPSDGESLVSMRERETTLFREHHDYFRGPLPLLGSTTTYRRGFIDRITVHNEDGLRDVLAALAIDHPATRCVAEIWLPDRLADDRERIRERLAELGRDCRVATGYFDDEPRPPIRFLEGEVRVQTADHEVAITADVNAPDASGYYAYLVRTTVTTDAQTRRWWYGSSNAVTEESIADEPPFSGTGHVAPFQTARLELALRIERIRDDDTSDVLWLAGATDLRAGAEKTPILVKPCEPITGELFAPPGEIEETPSARGPSLIVDDNPYPEHVNMTGAALPGAGVFDGNTRRLVTETGPIALPDLAAPGDSYVDATIGGVAGALAILQIIRGKFTTILSLLHVPNAPVHETFTEATHCGLWSPDGAMFALVAGHHRPRITVFDGRGRELASAPGPNPDDEHDRLPSLCWHDGALFAAHGGACVRLDVAAKTTTTSPIPHALGYAWRQYGAGAPSYHPQCGRIAWMMCIDLPSDRAVSGITLIGWRDRDGTYDTVSIPDHGWADKKRFGNVTVLPDGRILAIGTRIWLVEPTDRSIRNLGAAGNYTDHPTITVHDGKLRLWSHGAGPWWVEL